VAFLFFEPMVLSEAVEVAGNDVIMGKEELMSRFCVVEKMNGGAEAGQTKERSIHVSTDFPGCFPTGYFLIDDIIISRAC
jgi:hypothetical protein